MRNLLVVLALAIHDDPDIAAPENRSRSEYMTARTSSSRSVSLALSWASELGLLGLASVVSLSRTICGMSLNCVTGYH